MGKGNKKKKKDRRRNINANLVITLAGQQYISLENGGR